MSKIYVPELSQYQCYVVNNSDTIRAYKQTPTYNSNIEYRDYYIKSNYIYKDGYQTFGNYSTLPICLSTSELTSDVYYRNDLADIMIIFIVMYFVIIHLPLKIFFRLFRRFL